MKKIFPAVFLLSLFLHSFEVAAKHKSHSGKTERSHSSSAYVHKHQRKLTNGLQTKVRPKEGCHKSKRCWRVSYYIAGKKTANGERFNPNGLTAAHRTFPFGTKLRVEHPVTHRSVIVRVNDRGPFKWNRKLDLTRYAARRVGLTRDIGVDNLLVTVVSFPKGGG